MWKIIKATQIVISNYRFDGNVRKEAIQEIPWVRAELRREHSVNIPAEGIGPEERDNEGDLWGVRIRLQHRRLHGTLSGAVQEWWVSIGLACNKWVASWNITYLQRTIFFVILISFYAGPSVVARELKYTDTIQKQFLKQCSQCDFQHEIAEFYLFVVVFFQLSATELHGKYC